MSAQSEVRSQAPGVAANVPLEGLLSGLAGAATIAAWFFIMDVIRRQPFYTPTVLGTALFRGGMGLAAPRSLEVSSELVITFTWVHMLVFGLIGVAAAKLIEIAEREPSLGFGIVLFVVFFECAFFLACMVVAEPVLHALAWPEVLIGNLLASAAMVAVLWRRHPRLVIRP